MFLWFLVVAPVIVAEVFRSPMVDYRVVALGAVLPLAEALLGGPSVFHTLLLPVVVLTVVMLATQRRRLVRRRLLGLPIGLLLHLVLDATWADRTLLWWPAFGGSFGEGQVPEVDRALAVGLGLEVIAVAIGVWAARRYELVDPRNRSRLVRSGQLDRHVLSRGAIEL
ncbi:MAG: hypothetical protein O3C27_16340 [Actinomycetota bacterium]|nr:hypothetical protein [Actinomycetota bacterium]